MIEVSITVDTELSSGHRESTVETVHENMRGPMALMARGSWASTETAP